MADEIVDACCLINLYAVGDDFCSLLRATGSSFHVPQTVADEALNVCRPDEEDDEKTVKEEIDLSPAVEAQLIQLCDLQTPRENLLFVQFAAELSDGEAICLAIAQSRGWIVATDDRKAQRLAGQSGIAAVTTPELIKRWVDAESIVDAEVREVLQRIRRCARFIPRKGSPLFEWWMDRLGD